MSYRPFLLVAAGVLLGAATISATNVSAHEPEDGNGERRGNFGLHEGKGKTHGTKHVMEFSEELLGLSAEELKAEREAGKTMEEIVTAQGYESIESFRDEVEQKVREELAAEGLSEEEIDERIERHESRRQHKMQHMTENFDEAEARERLSNRGLSEDEIDERIQHIQDRIEEFNSQ